MVSFLPPNLKDFVNFQSKIDFIFGILSARGAYLKTTHYGKFRINFADTPLYIYSFKKTGIVRLFKGNYDRLYIWHAISKKGVFEDRPQWTSFEQTLWYISDKQ